VYPEIDEDDPAFVAVKLDQRGNEHCRVFHRGKEAPDGHLFTPLLYAAKNAALNSGIRDQNALYRLLPRHDADPNARDAKGGLLQSPFNKNEAGCCGKITQQKSICLQEKPKPKPRKTSRRVFNLPWLQETLLNCASLWEARATRRRCTMYDVDVGDDIIVRCHRKIVYPNGTIYSGFVDCGFECMQKQHRCVKADDVQLIATGHSMGAINAAFEREAPEVPSYSDAPESDLFSCGVCRNRYDNDSNVPRILPGCGHTFCQGCIDSMVATATSEDDSKFASPFACQSKSRIGVEFQINLSFKSNLSSASRLKIPTSPSPMKRKRYAPEVETCPRHADALVEVVCFDCGVLECLSCGFDCFQMQHKCIKTSEKAIVQEISRSVSKLDSIFETGSEKIQQRLQVFVHAGCVSNGGSLTVYASPSLGRDAGCLNRLYAGTCSNCYKKSMQKIFCKHSVPDATPQLGMRGRARPFEDT
jgi:hypothetical protein